MTLYASMGSSHNPFLPDKDMVQFVQGVVNNVYLDSDYQVQFEDKIFNQVHLVLSLFCVFKQLIVSRQWTASSTKGHFSAGRPSRSLPIFSEVKHTLISPKKSPGTPNGQPGVMAQPSTVNRHPLTALWLMTTSLTS